jgi:glycosyltransferase involved in cell wall biosynthesis
MRILHCIRSANPRSGGTIEGIRQLAQIHTSQGHQVEVASLDPPDAPWLKEFPVPLHGLGPVHSSYGFKPGFRSWIEAKCRSLDAVIGNGLWQYNSLAMRRACRRTGTPYFVFPHGMLDPWFKRTYPLKHIKKWFYWPWGEYPVLRDARAVFFTSEEERRLARESFWLYRVNEVVLGYGTQPPSGNAELQQAAFRGQFPGLDAKRILLFLGRIHPKKGCDLLLEAFARVATRDPALQLIFAGPDQVSWQSNLEAQSERLGIAKRVSWLGMLKGEVKWGALRCAEAFVLPSHQENFGIAVVEALACGTPVLISNQVNIWREIQADKAGLVEPDDLAGTTRLLENWLDRDVAQREVFSRNALACFQRHFEMTAVAERLIAYLGKSISGS